MYMHLCTCTCSLFCFFPMNAPTPSVCFLFMAITGSHLHFIPALALQGPADKSVIEGNDCMFVCDFSKIQLQSNTETLGEHESLESWLEGWSSVWLMLLFLSVFLFCLRASAAWILWVLCHLCIQQNVHKYQKGMYDYLYHMKWFVPKELAQ